MNVNYFKAHDGFVIVQRFEKPKPEPLPDGSVTLLRPPEEKKPEKIFEGWGVYLVLDSSVDTVEYGDEVVVPHTAIQSFEHEGEEVLFIKASSIGLWRTPEIEYED